MRRGVGFLSWKYLLVAVLLELNVGYLGATGDLAALQKPSFSGSEEIWGIRRALKAAQKFKPRQHHSHNIARSAFQPNKQTQEQNQPPRKPARQTLAATKEASGPGPRPYESSLQLPSGYQEYAIFHNVLMRSETELLFFVPDDSAAETAARHIPDVAEFLNRQWWQRPNMHLPPLKVTIVTPSLHAQYPDRCYRWIEHNTIWYSGTPFDHQNLYHFLYDNLIPLITAASDLGWYDVDKFMKSTKLPTSDEAQLIILQHQPVALTAPYNWIFDHITPDVHVSDRLAGSCFRTIMVGMDSKVRPYHRPSSKRHAELRRAALVDFQRFALEAIKRTHAMRGWAPLNLFQRKAGNRIRIGWVMRPKKAHNSRAALNEGEILDAMRQRYDADISVLQFKPGELGHAIEMVHALDILMGFHGAGLTNAVWLQPGAAVLQLVPYGWQGERDDFYPRAVIFEQIALNSGCHYLQWVNQDPNDAYFLPTDFPNRSQYVRHPDASTPLPRGRWLTDTVDKWWNYQDTMVNLTTFLPVADKAMQLVGGAMLTSALPAR